MSTYFTFPGTDNVVDLKKYRTYKEAYKLFTNYKTRISSMNKDDLLAERVRMKKELEGYPNHLLTKVKVQIFENATGTKL